MGVGQTCVLVVVPHKVAVAYLREVRNVVARVEELMKVPLEVHVEDHEVVHVEGLVVVPEVALLEAICVIC